MNRFTWNIDNVETLPHLQFADVENWLVEVARRHDRIVGDLNYVFCSDEVILKVNLDFLNHDYFTDIITFDRTKGTLVRGDIYISLDTVKSNASSLGEDYDKELLRVIVHGMLHLCGINDKAPGEREIMEQNENDALELYNSYNASF